MAEFDDSILFGISCRIPVKHPETACVLRRLRYVEYFEKLCRLHLTCRAIADNGDDRLQAELVALGLETVHEAPARTGC